ncbi:MAG: ethanolamine utilization protein [Leptotrichiaceae bacterium]|nr:ethanolamine utilization protein [Leptotrichiaceae bacterium]MBP6281063.1 ethanolamine utilization protein [Leptotrichiaceae bacterium]MBP7100911.1 ethanolamine utilization protein [Leptotrichiaceae bacterium]MBP9629391.1 ethanolamine utilization protein [Leptotrichiaceae bacterium]
MEKDALIEIITKRVVDELLKKENCYSNINAEKLLKIDFLGDDEYLKNNLKEHVDINIIENIEVPYINEQKQSEEKTLVVSNLCLTNLLYVSQGKKNFIVEYLLNGGNVYLIEEGLEYKKYTSPKNLLKLYDEYTNKIKSFGVKIIKRDEITNILKNKENVYIKGVITESKLRELNIKNKRIVLKNNSQITSLAQDYIKQNNIEVYYERGQ